MLLKDKNIHDFQAHEDSKRYGWKGGIMTGTGEAHVICNAVQLFIHTAESDPEKLPQCLNISRQIREITVGAHPQIQSSNLLDSNFSEGGASLFSIEYDEQSQSYPTLKVASKELNIGLFNQNISQD